MSSFAHSLLRVLRQGERALNAVIQPVVFTGMAVLIGVITLQIISRVFFTSVSWSEEIARFLLIWITFLGATLAFQRGRHIAVTFAVDALPSLPQHLCRIVSTLVVLGFLLSLVVIGLEYMQVQSFQRSASLRISMTWVYAIIPISAGLMAWYALVDLVGLVLGDSIVRKDEDSTEELAP